MLTLEFVQEQAEYLARIILACICGGVIGIERQQRVKAAGTRTHMMLALATALMMIISKYGFSDVAGNPGMSLDVSRVAAGIISGIGILGGGIIFTGKEVIRVVLPPRSESGRPSALAWRSEPVCMPQECVQQLLL